MADVVLPIKISFDDWFSQIRQDLPNLEFPNPDGVKNWRETVTQLINMNSLDNIPIPTKSTYPKDEDWRKWGAYFVDIMLDSV